MSHPYALIIATPEGPRSKVDPNRVLIGPDSIYPDALASQYSPDRPELNVIEGQYTGHRVPWLTGTQAHALAFLIRSGQFSPDEVLRMAESLRP